MNLNPEINLHLKFVMHKIKLNKEFMYSICENYNQEMFKLGSKNLVQIKQEVNNFHLHSHPLAL